MNRTGFLALAIFAFVGYAFCASTGETDCQRRRRNEQRATRNLTGLLVPECDEQGNYKAIQCFGEAVRGRPFCACYDNEFGQIKGPSRSLKSCNCIRDHHEWQQRSSSQKGPEPLCNVTSGEYNALQCDVDSHWCVDTDSGRQEGERQPGGCSSNLSAISCGVGGTHHGHGDSHSGSSHHGTSSHQGRSGSSHQGSSGHHTGDSSHSGHN
ncbi:U24-ctenitoxin-Pn1a [Dermacentor silvarum]|uniref:U24-ctenitoxin-Pn1a n=1 Tax=Dermacentor silvarum TaxID=543639 RepID=UPI00189BC5AB|nr:U24-ctenitoxin-Pn1a [Dermacentor silvarum]XP_049526876.1 U24-ctenitoxin-Pn1a [Dermacentor silvarum]XP_049526877.1 U24-ctenitoxin-Pn1a [Dermacentor silvarum]XP_049526878.1 U24-ctenitoxin-Pn1a [Dermacentor silvarum]